MESLFYAIFLRKKYKKSQNENKKQTRFAQQYKAILTPSTILKNDLINLLKVDGQKVYIVPPFVDMPDIVTENSNKTFTFGFIGNDFYEKGGFLLLKALKNLTNFDFKLKILTNSSRNILLQRYIKSLKLDDKIEFVPHLTGMEEFYSDVDCLIMPSKRESFGLEVLEAMSYGKIVVISSRCGVKDIIEPFNNGFIFDITQKQVRNLEKVLEYILINKDDFDNLRQKAVFTASVYNFEKFVQKFYEF